MIPLLSLGVPRDAVTAVLLGAFAMRSNVFDVYTMLAFGMLEAKMAEMEKKFEQVVEE
jgi:TctA family transporter